MSDPDHDAGWMRRALALAAGARPSPNPRVGAVVVRDGVSVGEGFHRAPGDDHGEVAALKAAGSRARGATVYVTLEPCNHHGRTPPCTEALLAAGVARVVLGVRDPNPRVQGGGIERLRAAGVAVTEGVEREACAALVRAWTKHTLTERPYVVLKAGMSLDGRIATRTGESRWITGPAARADAHALRARADAVLVGIGTVLADDPELTPRDAPPGASSPPARVVLDTTARLPLTARVVRTARVVPTWVLCGDGADGARTDALEAHGVRVFRLPRADDRVDLHAALGALGGAGVVELLVEGGGAVHGAFLDRRAADAVVCYVAGVILGGREAPAAFGGLGVARLAEAHRLKAMAVSRCGDDLRVEGELDDVYRDHHGGR